MMRELLPVMNTCALLMNMKGFHKKKGIMLSNSRYATAILFSLFHPYYKDSGLYSFTQYLQIGIFSFYMVDNGMEYNHSRHKPTIHFISAHPGETVVSVK